MARVVIRRQLVGSFQTAVATLQLLNKVVSQSGNLPSVQALIDLLRAIGKTLHVAQPLGTYSLRRTA